QVDRRLLGEDAILAHDAEGAAIPASAAAVRKKAIGFDEHRILRFEQLYRDVGEIADRIRSAVLSVAIRPAALAGAIVELEVQEGLPLRAFVAGEDDRELRAAGAGGNAVGQELRARAQHRGADAV